MQRSFRSFIKNRKECKDRMSFWKERMPLPNPDNLFRKFAKIFFMHQRTIAKNNIYIYILKKNFFYFPKIGKRFLI